MNPLDRVLACAAAATGGALLLAAGVGPIAFNVLGADPYHAGEIAGQVFVLTEWIGLALALVVLFLRGRRGPARGYGALAMALTSGIQLGILVPFVRARGAGWPWSFQLLHALAGSLHLVMVLQAFVLAWVLAAAERRAY